ncbi:hypothetical protein Hanom_Chr06g00550101 [Helianthus anomalus]
MIETLPIDHCHALKTYSTMKLLYVGVRYRILGQEEFNYQHNFEISNILHM